MSIANLIRGKSAPVNNPIPEPPVKSSEELKRELRREKVLMMLEARPEIQRAFLTDIESDPDNVILSLAVRGLGTCELSIERQKYDPFLLLELI